MLKQIAGKILLVVYLILSVFGTTLVFNRKPSAKYVDKEAGWVIGAKYAHDPEQIIQLIKLRPVSSVQMAKGVGWNIANELFRNSDEQSPEIINYNIKRAVELIFSYPEKWRAAVLEGIGHAFYCCSIPKMDPGLHKRFLSTYNAYQEEPTPKPPHRHNQ